MKNWNIHSMWIIGILLAILIGSMSVDWNAIKDLPGIISFAVGLASLILAVIAIFQTLSSTGSVEASLAAVREATVGSAKVSAELAASTAVIQQAAIDAQAASASAMAATSNFSTISASILESNEAGRQAVSRLREDILAKSTGSFVTGPSGHTSPTAKFVGSSMGGASLTYAAFRSLSTNKPMKLAEIFSGDTILSFEMGYMACLGDVGFFEFDYKDGAYTVRSTAFADVESEIKRLKTRSYGDAAQITYDKRMAQVDAYFDAAEKNSTEQ